MYCPICASKNVKLSTEDFSSGEVPEGGIYVAKSTEGMAEFYDDAYPFECEECGQIFYLGYKINESKNKQN